MRNEFLRPRLVGKRFEGHTLPLDILKDFSALGEMLLEIAKRKYLAANPSRKRLPNGFTQAFQLHLTAIEEGSTVAVLAPTQSSLFPLGQQDYFYEAKQEVIEAIAAINNGKRPSLEPELLRYFDRFGRSLLAEETIELLDSKNNIVPFTQTSRRKLIIASQASSWTDEMVLKGRIPMVDQSNAYFELELRDGSKLRAPLLETHKSDILKYTSDYERHSYVAIKGVVVCESGNKPKAFESIEYINPLDPLDVEMRLDELAALKPGWLNGKGLSLDKKSLTLLANLFNEYFSPELPLPYLYPTAEGGVQAEWTLNSWEVSLDVELPSLEATFHAFNVDTYDEKDFDGDLMLDEGSSIWGQINTELLAMQGGENEG